MELNEIKTALADLNEVDGVAKKLITDFSKEEIAALAPYIKGEMDLPDDESDTPDVELPETVAEPETVTDPVPELDPVIVQPDPNEIRVAEARSAIERARARKEKYRGLISEQDKVLAEPEPDELDDKAWRDWSRRQQKAQGTKSDLAFQYAESRDLEESEDAERFVAKSTTDAVIASMGNDFEHLKMSKSFDVVNAEYDAWTKKAVAASGQDNLQVAFDRFNTDAAFAATVGPLPKDYQGLFTVLRAIERQKTVGGDLESNLLAQIRSEGGLKKTRADASAAAAKEIARKNDEALQRAGKPGPAASRAGSSTPPKQLVLPKDAESARAWIDHVQPKLRSGYYKDHRNEFEKDNQWTERAKEILSGLAV